MRYAQRAFRSNCAKVAGAPRASHPALESAACYVLSGTVAFGGRLRVKQTLMSDLVDSEDIVCAGWVPVSP